MKIRKLNSRSLRYFLLGFVSCFAALGCLHQRLAHGQARQKTSSELDHSLARIASGEFSASDVVVIGNSGAVQAIPALEEQFKRATDIDTKVTLASGLVKLKDRDDTYWKFLLEQATLVIDSDIPDFEYSESRGRVVRPSPEIQAWADAHKVSVNTARLYARYDYPGTFLQFAAGEDPRGLPLLRRALHSHNYLIVTWAANGLALIQDKQSIPLIIAAIQTWPAGYRPVIAKSLIYFDDVQAQRAVDTYMPKDWAKGSRELRAQGIGIFGK